MTENGVTNIFAVFGVGKHQKCYNIGKLIETIRKRNAQGFPYFHPFTGSDTSSSFFTHGKCQFGTHDEHEEVLTEVFIELSNMPSEITSQQIDIISKYLIKKQTILYLFPN